MIQINQINQLYLYDFIIPGYTTILQKRENLGEKVSMFCLVKEKLMESMTIRKDLMSTIFPSIWLELKSEGKPSVIIGGFYWEWTHNGLKTLPLQITGIKEFSKQIERAAEEGEQCVVMGDANLCYQKWRDDDFSHKYGNPKSGVKVE